jgi:membrane-associated phospholipid phosphatase
MNDEGPVEERLADKVDAEGGEGRERIAQALRQAGEADRAVYAAIASTPMPTLDEPLRRLSESANYSRLWLGIAGVLAVVGGRRGRRAAVRGVVAIGATSAAVNLGVKSLYERARPDRDTAGVPEGRHVPMPSSTSFPSGHSASGFAFATAVGSELPVLAIPLEFLAGAVAYSRVHTGVHYPCDAVVGSIVGAGTGQITSAVLARATRARSDRRNA